MRKIGIIAVLSLMALALAAVPALAQSGHFVTGGANAVKVTAPNANTSDLIITGKVAGLGGTTFEIFATADATANYACQNRGANSRTTRRSSRSRLGSVTRPESSRLRGAATSGSRLTRRRRLPRLVAQGAKFRCSRR